MMRIRGRLVLLFFCIKAAVCFNSWRAAQMFDGGAGGVRRQRGIVGRWAANG